MDEIIDSISTCPATEENIEILQRLGVAVNIIVDDNGREFVDGVGIPIGNYVSQYDGNFNLSVVDHWLKEVKGVKYYFRYMDDMVIFGSSKEELHKLKRELDEFMAVNLKQVIKSNTNRLNEHDEILKSNSEMIGAIKELATEVKYMRGDLNETIERLNKLESKDGDKWEKFKGLIVAGLVTLILGYLAVSVGLK